MLYKLLIVTALFCFGLNLNAQIKKTGAVAIEEQFVLILGDSIFASKYECSNQQYANFLAANPDSAKHVPDSIGWTFQPHFNRISKYYAKFGETYYNNPVYAQYPVVNISWESANEYCVWLTNYYNNLPDRKYKKVQFRLPKPRTWEIAAFGPQEKGKKNTMVFPWEGKSTRNEKGVYLANFAPITDAIIKRDSTGQLQFTSQLPSGTDIETDGYIYTAPCIGPYPTNSFGLHHMAGNVSEFTAMKHITKGGGFFSPGYYLQVKNNEPEFPNLEKGAAFVGFRPFMYVLEK
jgi:formylglycine-generating enzyme required for sulfatase activity